MFDVLAIRGENSGRLIPKSPKDKLARFSFGKKYLGVAAGGDRKEGEEGAARE